MIPRFNKEPALREGHIHAEHRHRINDTTDVHFHDYFEIEYIIEGDGINYIDGKMCSLESGLLYFLSPINTHNLIQKKTNLLHLAFEESHCDTTLLAPLVSSGTQIIFHLSLDDRAYVSSLIFEIIKNSADNTYTSMLLNVLLVKLNKLLASQYTTHNINFSAPRNGILYIINNFKNNISLNDAAAYVGLTPTYFSAIFKEEIGITFKEYLDSVRFDHARNLILYSDRTMHEICAESGFTNYENFVRRFKQRFGQSPRSYKKLASSKPKSDK